MGYFDAGVYGSLGWNRPGPAPIGKSGIVRFDSDLSMRWEFPGHIDNPWGEVVDCMALNVVGEVAWASYYPGCPVIRIDGGRVSGWRSTVRGARALVVGFAYFPEALAAHLEQLAALPIPDRSLAQLRDRLVDATLSGAVLDRSSLDTILTDTGAGADLTQARTAGGMAFSFTRSDADPVRAVRDLEEAIDALAADSEIGLALAAATERLQAGEDEAFEEQQRLLTVREKIKERLASLGGTD